MHIYPNLALCDFVTHINKLTIIHKKNITMKLFFLLILPLCCFSQEMVGVWKKADKADTAIEFKSDGTYNVLDLKNPEKKVSQDITVSNRTIKDVTVKYRTKQISSIRFIEFEYKAEGYPTFLESVRYKIEKGSLYLTKEKYVKVKGVSTREDYQEVYTRVN